MGFPFEHGFHATLMAMGLCDLLDLDNETASRTYYTTLLSYSGCTTDAADAVQVFAGEMTSNFIQYVHGSRTELAKGILAALPPAESTGIARVREIARRLPRAARGNKPHQRAMCEVGEMLARRLGLPESINVVFRLLNERWDGKGDLKRAKGEEIPLPLRIALVAHDAAFQRLVGGEEHAVSVIKARGGAAFDPNITEMFGRHSADLFAAADAGEGAWDQVLQLEPAPHLTLDDDAIDRALAAIGDFSDLISPSFAGHSSGLAKLATEAAQLSGFSEEEVTLIRRAAWVHDVGRVAIDTRIWEKPTSLTPDEVEQVRLHPYHTERILIRSDLLGTLAPVASNHHEHLDGSGYHRGAVASMLTRPARLLAVADIYHAMTEPRPHRRPLPSATAASLLEEQVREGHLDPQMVAAVLRSTGQETPPMGNPKGLTNREVEVLGLLARGLQTKQMAIALGISAKTADTHIQNSYRKIGVSTRAAATLFAMETGLVPSGELPIAD